MTIVGIAGDTRRGRPDATPVFRRRTPAIRSKHPADSERRFPGRADRGPAGRARGRGARLIHGIIRKPFRGRAPWILCTRRLDQRSSVSRWRFSAASRAGAAAGSRRALRRAVPYGDGQPTQIGIRLALGAPRGLIFRMVAGRALKLAAIGVMAGGLGCLALRQVLAAAVFGIGPSDPAALGGAIAVLPLATALTAALIPARRASQVDPMAALREE